MFKRKQKIIEEDYPIVKKESKKIILSEYVIELRKLGYSDEQIKQKFQEKNYPEEFLDWLLQLNTKQEVKKMAKEIEEEDEDDYEDDEDEEEDDDEVELEEEDAKPKKAKKKVRPEVKQVKKEKVEQPVQQGPTLDDVLNNHEQRLQALEARLFRLSNI